MPKRKLPPSADDLDLGRLCAAYRSSRQRMKRFRSERVDLARKIAGDHWSEETADVPRPVNFLSLYTRVVPRSVVPKDPRVSLSTHEPKYRSTVKAMERWVNEEFARDHLGDEIRRVFLDALLSVGIMKVGIASPSDAALAGYGVAAGKPFAERVDLDDFAFDPHARDIKKASWYAQRQRVPIETIRNSPLYDAAVAKKATATDYQSYDDQGDQKVETLQADTRSADEAFDYVEIVEFYIPRLKLIVTVLADEAGNVYAEGLKGDDGALDVREWVGPDCGPYHFLALQLVPGNAMPKGPAQDITTLDEHFNAVVVKLIEQAGRQKEVLAASSAADKDAEKIISTPDGGVCRVDNVDKLKPLGFGGPNPNNQQFALGMWDLLNKLGGNVEAMAGLGAQAGTATQEKIINANSSATVADMQELTVKLIGEVADALMWYYHYHPSLVMNTSWSPPSNPQKSVPTPVYPSGKAPPGGRERNFPFEALDCKVDPYSLQHQSPQGKMAFIVQVVTQILAPLAPLLQQQGVQIDVNALLAKLADLGGVAELAEVVKYAEPPQAPTDGGGGNELPHDKTLPTQTERTYNRVNPSEQTNSGQRTAVQQLLAASSKNGNGQTTTIGR